jgi:polar amino acid transport system substrate-binding protein
MHYRRWFRLASIVAVAAAVLVLFAACGGEEKKAENTPIGSATSAAKVAELQDGVLQVGSDISYAPIEFFEEGTQNAEGLDVDLADALAEELGVRAEFINTGFDGIIGALNVERFDILMSAMTVTEERQKEIDFIPYLNAGTDILVAQGNPKNIKTIEDLSGLTVGVQIATIQVKQLEDANAQLKAAGKPEISVLIFDQNPVVANDARLSEGKLEVLGLAVEAAPYGIGVRKGSTQLKAAIEGALQKLQASGKYDQILAKWGLEGGAIE